MSNARLRLWLLCVTAILSASALTAATQTWNGDSPANDNWSNGDNWVGDPIAADVPGAADSAIFAAGGPHTITLDAAGPDSVGMLTIGSSTQISLDKNLSVGQLDIAPGASLVVVGTGTLAVQSHGVANGSIVINAADAAIGFTTAIDITSLASFTNTGTLQLAAGATLTTDNTIDLGDVEVSGSLNVSGDLMSTGELSITSGNLLANAITVADLTMAQGSSMTASLASQITNETAIGGTVTFAGGLTFSGAMLSIGEGGQLETSAGTTLTFVNLVTVDIEIGRSLLVQGDLDTQNNVLFQNQNASAAASGAGQVFVGGNWNVRASIFDTNNAGAGFEAISFVINGDFLLDDSAGLSVDLGDSAFTFDGLAPKVIVEAPMANFDGSFDFGRNTVRATMNYTIPTGTVITLGGLRLEGTTTLNFTDAAVTLDGNFEHTGTGSVTAVAGTLRPGADLIGMSPLTINGFTVANGETLGVSGTVTIDGPIVVDNGGTLDLIGSHTGANVVTSAGQDLTIEDGGHVIISQGGLPFNVLFPNLTIGGNLNANGGDIDFGDANSNARVDVLGDLTLGNLLGGTDATLEFGIGGHSEIHVEGDFLMATAGSRFLQGSGGLHFLGNADISASEDSVGFAPGFDFSSVLVGADPLPKTYFQFEGSAMHSFLTAIGQGNYVSIRGVKNTSSVTHNGNIRAFGALILGNSGATQEGFTTWTQTNGEIFIGEAAFPADLHLSTFRSTVDLGNVTIREYTGVGAPTTASALRIWNDIALTQNNVILGSITIEGDTTDNDGLANGDESHNASLDIQGAQVSCDGILIQDGGAVLGGAGKGGSLSIAARMGFDSTLNIAIGNVEVGNGTAGLLDSGASFTGSGNLVFPAGGILNVRDFATFSAFGGSMTSAAGASYSIISSLNANLFYGWNTSFTASVAGGLTMQVGASFSAGVGGLSFKGSSFSNLDANGLQIVGGSGLGEFNTSSFSSGQNGGAHITFLGAASGDAGARINADNFTFDASTVGGDWANIVADGGNIVRVANDADDVNVTFFAPANTGSFGVDSNQLTLTGAMAENDDNDGNDDNAPDNDIIWDLRQIVSAAISGSSMRTNLADTTKAAAIMFTLGSSGGDSGIDEIRFQSDLTFANGSLVGGSGTSVVLFLDDGDTDDAFDDMDTFIGISNVNIGPPNYTFDLSGSPLMIPDGTTARLGVAVAFQMGTQGNVRFILTSVTPTSMDTAVEGASFESTLTATAADLSVSANLNNGFAGGQSSFLAQLANPMVLAFDVENNADALDTMVHAIEIQVTANPTSLTNVQLANFIDRLVLFSSDNTGFNTTYDAQDPSFGAGADDALFGVQAGGSANITFNVGGSPTATVTFNNGGGLAIAPGETKSFFLVLDPTSSNLVDTATDAGLTLRFRFADAAGDGTAGGIGSANMAADRVAVTTNQAPFVGEIFSKTFVVNNQINLGNNGGGGCAIGQTDQPWWPMAFLMLLGLGFAILRRAHEVTPVALRDQSQKSRDR